MSRKFEILHNFISPVTGRVKAEKDYVLVGDRQDIATPSPTLIDLRLDLINLRKHYTTLTQADLVVGHENKEIPKAQVLSKLPDGILKHAGGIVAIATPDGDYVTYDTFEQAINNLQVQIDVIEGEIDTLQGQVSALESAVSIIEGEITALQFELGVLQAELSALSATVSALGVTVAGHTIAIATLQGQVSALQTRIDNLQVTIVGDIIGSGLLSGPIPTTFNVTRDFDVRGFKVVNLKGPAIETDAVNLDFIWNLAHDEIGVIWE